MAEIIHLFPKDQPLEPTQGRLLDSNERPLYIKAETEYLLRKYGLVRENVQLKGSASDGEITDWLITHRTCFRGFCQEHADEIFPRLRENFSGTMDDLKNNFEQSEIERHPPKPETPIQEELRPAA